MHLSLCLCLYRTIKQKDMLSINEEMAIKNRILMDEFYRCDDNIKEFTQMIDVAMYDKSEVDAYIDSQRNRMDEIVKEVAKLI